MAIKDYDTTTSGTTKKLTAAKGEKISGHYIGFRTFKNEYGVACVHKFLQPGTSDIEECYGTKLLDRWLSDIWDKSPGCMVWIVYNGKVKKGTKTPHDFKIKWDGEDCVDVLTVTASDDQDTEESDDSDGDVAEDVADDAAAAANVARATEKLAARRPTKTA